MISLSILPHHEISPGGEHSSHVDTSWRPSDRDDDASDSAGSILVSFLSLNTRSADLSAASRWTKLQWPSSAENPSFSLCRPTRRERSARYPITVVEIQRQEASTHISPTFPRPSSRSGFQQGGFDHFCKALTARWTPVRREARSR